MNVAGTNSLNHAAQPLSGVRVIDFTQVMLGPCATQVLAITALMSSRSSASARAICHAPRSDDPAGQHNPIFCSLNRNKRSFALDLKAPAGLAVVHKLAATPMLW